MGEAVGQRQFEHRDFVHFGRALAAETDWLHDLVERDALSRHAPMAGLELEAWLVDADGRPAPRNAEFIARCGSADVVTEIGRFNVEFNVAPQPVAGRGLARLEADLRARWQRGSEVAAAMGLQLVSIGILPSLTEAELNLGNLSAPLRYRVLNQQVLRQRHGRPVRLAIDGPGGERLDVEHHDVMLEAAATSFQVHLQLPAPLAARAHNAALIAAAPVLALAGNSPLLFGRALWQETRIPLFEQALGVGTRVDGAHDALPRVGFGSGYVGYSLVECFRENLERFEPLLPVRHDEPPARLAHLRLHNGTVWRWHRPVVGFDAEDGAVHIRTEHRPLAAGPSLADMMADLAFTIGLSMAFATADEPPEALLPFAQAKANFYAAARRGLEARLVDLDGCERPATHWLRELLPRARAGLARLDVDGALADGWIGLLQERLQRGRTGARWQLDRWQALRGDLEALTRAYAAQQANGRPVHAWP
jgi:gamma-glutamyl:cysteine ligase YbdK (ATP-grasp superfamily)